MPVYELLLMHTLDPCQLYADKYIHIYTATLFCIIRSKILYNLYIYILLQTLCSAADMEEFSTLKPHCLG